MTVIKDDYSPVRVGDTGAPFIAHFIDKTGNPIDLTGLTGSNITMRMQRETPSAIVKDATGTFTILDAINGIASFAFSSADVNTEGTWNLLITITRASKPLHADAKKLRILAVPVLTP